MKKLLPAFLLFTSGLIAQPTFTSNDIYGIGYTFQTTAVTNSQDIDLLTTGANSTWNFPNLTGGAVTTSTHVSPAGQPGASNFPNATMAQTVSSSQGNPTTYYIRKSNTEFAIDGFYQPNSSGASVGQLNPDMDLFQFPFTFNSTYTQPVSGTVITDPSPYIFYRNGSQSSVCDGYGTLTTPMGTYQNVLRIKTIQTYSDSADIEGFPYILEYDIVIYNWVSVQSKGVSLLSYSTFSVNGGTPSVSAGMSDEPTLSAGVDIAPLNFIISPNPVMDIVNFALPSNSALDAEIYSVTGQLIQKTTLTANGQSGKITVSALPAGTYILRLSDKKQAGIQRFVVM